MTRERPPIQVPATAEYLLAYFRSCHRRAVVDGAADPEFDLTPATTIADLAREWCLPVGSDLAREFESRYGLSRRLSEWEAVLEPCEERTIGELFAFLAASGAMRPAFEPLGFLGAKPCTAAGAFAAVRSILREAGADADAIKPSTPLEPHLQRYPWAFIGPPLSDVAPGTLSEHAFHPSRAIRAFFRLWFVLVATTPVAILALLWLDRPGGLAERMQLHPLSALPFLLACLPVAAWLDLRLHLSRHELTGLRTFEDLARALAAGES